MLTYKFRPECIEYLFSYGTQPKTQPPLREDQDRLAREAEVALGLRGRTVLEGCYWSYKDLITGSDWC